MAKSTTHRTALKRAALRSARIFYALQERRYPIKHISQHPRMIDSTGERRAEITHFWPASMSRYLRSRRVCSGVFMLTNVVAIPVLPLRPVRPIWWT